MKLAAAPRKKPLSVDQLKWTGNPESFEFESTE